MDLTHRSAVPLSSGEGFIAHPSCQLCENGSKKEPSPLWEDTCKQV